MLRRQALSLLATATAVFAGEPLDPVRGCTLLLDLKTDRITTNSEALAATVRVPPVP